MRHLVKHADAAPQIVFTSYLDRHLLFQFVHFRYCLVYQSKFAGAFLEPVNTDFYPTYLDLVTIPMDLGTVGKKLKTGTYLCVDDFVHDMRLVWSNCMVSFCRGFPHYSVGFARLFVCEDGGNLILVPICQLPC